MLHLRIKMRSSQYAAPRQDTDYTGAGVARSSWGGLLDEMWPPRSPCVYKPIWATVPSRHAPLALKGLFLGYNDLQDGFEGLWNMRLGAGRGIWDLSAA
jgi:hypothetical protein